MDKDINKLTEYIVCILIDLVKEKEKKGMLPFSVSMVEIQDSLLADARYAISSLCKQRVLTFHKTLNDVRFEFTPSK
jgi:hypothetical protein